MSCDHRQVHVLLVPTPNAEGVALALTVACSGCGLAFVFRGPRVHDSGLAMLVATTPSDSRRHEQVRAFIPRGSGN